MRLSRAATLLLAGLVVLDLVAISVTIGIQQADPLRVAAAELGHARVVIIVGPVGSLTDYYRGLADDAAAAARRVTDNVATVYSPDATWPAVRRAMQGASIIVYLGHGNGWPSPYRNALHRASQNGLGLNPVTGADDDAHQYFGEAAIASAVRLAPGAVVLLHHLCYASGAGEPGMPDPSLDVARQRVDNFGAGWLAAGAAAVVAESYLGPAYYVAALLGGQGTPEQIWEASPTFHGNVQASTSTRTPGAQVLLDPDQPSSGYHRSLVTLPGAATRADAPWSPGSSELGISGDAGSLVVPGGGPAEADLRGLAVAGSVNRLVITFDALMEPLLPDRFEIGTRWTRIDAVDTASSDPGAAATADPSGAPDTAPATDAALSDPPSVDMVVAESHGSLIATEPASGSGPRRTVEVTLPTVPGVYRLASTLHDGGGIAYDAATQALVPALIVHVTGGMWVSYGVPDQVNATAGEPISVSIRVANTGSQDWESRPLGDAADPEPQQVEPEAHVVARWLPLDDGSSDGPSGAVAASTPIVVVPGSSHLVDLAARAPGVPGWYLLVVDLVTASGRSLAAAGVPPALIRVEVTAPPWPDDVPGGERP